MMKRRLGENDQEENLDGLRHRDSLAVIPLLVTCNSSTNSSATVQQYILAGSCDIGFIEVP